MSDTLKIILDNPLKVSVDGNFQDVYELEFRSPTYQDRDEAAFIQQQLSRSVLSLADRMGVSANDAPQNAAPDEGERTADEVKFLLESGDGNVSDVIKAFYKMAVRPGACTVYDSPKTFLQQTHVNNLEYKEAQRICFEYIAHFLAQ